MGANRADSRVVLCRLRNEALDLVGGTAVVLSVVIATVGMVFVGLGAVAGVLAWLVMLWASLIAIGALLFAIAVAREDVAPRPPVHLLGSAWIVGIASWTTICFLEVGSRDEWGDYWLANILGLMTGTLLFALALVMLGRWLRSEEPVQIELLEPVLPA